MLGCCCIVGPRKPNIEGTWAIPKECGNCGSAADPSTVAPASAAAKDAASAAAKAVLAATRAAVASASAAACAYTIYEKSCEQDLPCAWLLCVQVALHIVPNCSMRDRLHD